MLHEKRITAQQHKLHQQHKHHNTQHQTQPHLRRGTGTHDTTTTIGTTTTRKTKKQKKDFGH